MISSSLIGLSQRIALLCTALLIYSSVTNAQVPGVSLASDTPENRQLLDNPAVVESMVARLSDREVRELLLQKLAANKDEKASENQTNLSLIETIEGIILGVGQSVVVAVQRLPMLATNQGSSFGNFFSDRGIVGVMVFVTTIGLGIVLALVAEYLINRGVRHWRDRINQVNSEQGFVQATRLLALRLLLDLIGLIVFTLVTRVIIVALLSPSELPFAWVLIFNMIIIPRLMAAFSRFLLAPHRADLRIAHTDDVAARFIHRHLVSWFVLFGFTQAIVAFNAMNGVPMGAARLGFWLNLALHLYLIWIAWLAAPGLTTMMRGPDETTLWEDRIARAYPWFIVGISAFMWIIVEYVVSIQRFDLLAGGRHVYTMLILVLAPVINTLVRGIVKHAMPPHYGEGVIAERAYLATQRSYIRIGRVLAFSLVLFFIASLWGLDLRGVTDQDAGASLAARLFKVAGVFASGYLIWELVSWYINSHLAREQTSAAHDLTIDEPAGGEGGGAGSSRSATVLPLVRLLSQSMIVVMTLLLGLGNLGIDITPLLAGAGIAGLAIGFGAQKLVADVVSGIFFLIDDAFRAGEYVDVEGTMGTVEKISMRSMQLRHHRGFIHTIPYGEIPKITNFSRDWVIMKMKFTVPFETDLQKVKKIFKKIGQEMMAAEEFSEDFMQPFKSQGVLEMDDLGIVVRGKFMAKPGRQFTLRKEIYARVQREFEANNIQFARREVKVKIHGNEYSELDENAKQAASAAAFDAGISNEQDNAS